MGRVKLQIKRLESMNNRQVTYSKRRNGILKKAKELSILCDIDLLLLMFSPTGKPTLSTGGKRMEDILARFLRLTPEEREKRRMESLDTLKKTFKKLDHDINIEEFGGASSNQANQATEELSNDLRRIQAQLSDVKEKLWCYGDEPHQINTIEQAREVETNIQKAIIQMSALKQILKNQQYIVHDGNNQLMLHGGFCTSLSVEGDHHQAYPTPWMQFENQSVLLPGDPGSLLTQSDTDSLANSNTCIRSRELISGKEPYIEESASSHYTYLCDLNRDVSGLQWPFERASFSRDTDSLANSNTCIHSRELISGKEPYIEESASSHYTYLCDLNRDVSRLQWPFERASFSRDSLANSNTCIQSRELIAGQEPYIEESAINHYTYLCDLNKDVSGLQWPFESASFSRDTDSLANSNTCIRSRELIAGQEPYIEESASSHYTYPCDLNRDVSGLQWPFERASFSCDTDSLANSNTFIHSRAGQEPYIEESASSRYTYLCDLNRDVSGLQWPFERASFSLDQGNVILKAYKGNTQPETCLGLQGYDLNHDGEGIGFDDTSHQWPASSSYSSVPPFDRQFFLNDTDGQTTTDFQCKQLDSFSIQVDGLVPLNN